MTPAKYYNMPSLHNVQPTQVESILAQVERASIMATAVMRLLGLPLDDSEDVVPTAGQVEWHVRGLVNEAVEGYLMARDAAPMSVVEQEIEGYASDRLFDVVVESHADVIRVSVFMRLV